MDLHSKEIYPLLVSSVQGSPDTPESREEIWRKARALPQHLQDLLLSDEIKIYILEKSQEMGLDRTSTENFSRLIRNYFFAQGTPENIALELGEVFGKDKAFGQTIIAEIDDMKLAAISDGVAGTPEVLTETPATELLTLDAAYNKYPQVLKQLVTTNKIVSKPFLNPLAPTVANWIAVYEKVNGVKKHSTIERGDFLYKSQACKAISDSDRNKLSQLLGARDNESTLLFDVTKGGILWQKKSFVGKEVTQPTREQETASKNQLSDLSGDSAIKPAEQLQERGEAPLTSETAETAIVKENHPFSPNISRKHATDHLSDEPQIVTRPRTTLGASSQNSRSVDPTPISASTEQQNEELPHFVGSARQVPNVSQDTPPVKDQDITTESNENADSQGAATDSIDEFQINFSSGQTLPSEKAKDSEKAPVPPQEPKVATLPKRSPFHIDPMGRGN